MHFSVARWLALLPHGVKLVSCMLQLVLGRELRKQFPIFAEHAFRGRAFHYLDTAASAQKPASVIERITTYLSKEHANIHRGAYALSANATDLYDEARKIVANFLGVAPRNIIFTKGATEAINLAAYSLSNYFNTGDTVLLSVLEHHSNIVPWQLLAKRRGVVISFADANDDASLNIADALQKILNASEYGFCNMIPVIRCQYV